MWLITESGFYSAVEHREDPDRILIRARDRGDLERLVELVDSLSGAPTPRIVEMEDADYLYRIEVFRQEWIDACAAMAGAVNYANFKSMVGERRGHDRAAVYGRVWSVLLTLQPLRKFDQWAESEIDSYYRDEDLFGPEPDREAPPKRKRLGRKKAKR
jgi:hypothetical protein